MSEAFKRPLRPHGKWQSGQKEWSFKAPSFDNRSGESVSAGDSYGVGFRTPVGTHEAKGYGEGPIPFEPKCFSPEEVFEHEDISG